MVFGIEVLERRLRAGDILHDIMTAGRHGCSLHDAHSQ